MNWKSPVLLTVVTLLGLKVHLVECESHVVRNVRPIIGEIFDMLLESIEAKRREENGSLDVKFPESGRLEIAHQEKPKKPRMVMRGRVGSESLLDRIEIVDRNISFQDGQMSLRLGIIANSTYGSHSVLVLKQWSEDYSEVGEDYGLLCSSSNINGVFMTRLSQFREVPGADKNTLVFEMRKQVEQLKGRTFLLCLSSSITSNRSVYITKLSFSSSKEREESGDEGEQNFEVNNELLGHYEFPEMDKDGYDQILVKTRAPSGQKCSDFVLALASGHGDHPVPRGVLLSEKGAASSESLCFWSLRLENSLFKESSLLGIVQRHKNGKSSTNISTVRFLPLSYSQSRARPPAALSKSLPFKALFLALSLIPVLLLTLGAYAILTEVWAATLSRLPEKKKYLDGSTYRSGGCEQRDVSRNRDDREKGVSLRAQGRETVPAVLSSFSMVTRKSLNSEESGLSSSGENDRHVVKDDPFRYFDSDCSISTHTGA